MTSGLPRDADGVCPCGVDSTYETHCGKIHRAGAGLGVTAESLMRARYSAYVMLNRDFLLASWHPDTRPERLGFDPDLSWLGLDVVEAQAGGALDATGIVEFKARFNRAGEFLELHERSNFVRLDGQWVYVSSE